MKIIIRLVGYSEIINNNKYVYEHNYRLNKIFNFEIFKMIFNNYSDIISSNELNNCTLTYNSTNLKKDSLIDIKNTTYRVFIFTANTEIKNKFTKRVRINNNRKTRKL